MATTMMDTEQVLAGLVLTVAQESYSLHFYSFYGKSERKITLIK